MYVNGFFPKMVVITDYHTSLLVFSYGASRYLIPKKAV